MPIPDLRFGFGNSSGFTPAGVMAFDDLRPAAVIRELIQNGLDAARKAKACPAVMEFKLTRAKLNSVPGIKSYKIAFEKAIDRQEKMTGELPGQAELVVNRIRAALAKTEVSVLTVLDNGIGLDEARMNALLSDGVSLNDAKAAGSYGNGHSTALPASDLRYILYGGLTSGSERIGAGHAVLASHIEAGQDQLKSGDGFYIRDFNAGDQTLYSYATNSQVPEFIVKELDEIKNRWKSGSAVIIPAFNNFLEKRQTLWDMVSHAASANFFVAIEDGDLEIFVRDPNNKENPLGTVNKLTLSDILDQHKEKRRARAFLNGHRAHQCYRVYANHPSQMVDTTMGKVSISLLEEPSDGITRVDLVRNGMWITDRLPTFSGKFASQMPFHAVLSLNADDGGDFFDAIRIAEGPLHDRIILKRLQTGQSSACEAALKRISEWLIENTQAVTSEPYEAPDFLVLDFGDDVGKISGGSRKRSFIGAPAPARSRPYQQLSLFSDDPDDPDEPAPPGDKPKPRKSALRRKKNRPQMPSVFQAVSRPVGKNRRRIVIQASQDYSDVELRLVVDEALDATCERHGQDAYAPVVLSNVTFGEGEQAFQGFDARGEPRIGISLGNLKAGVPIEIETDYTLVGDFRGLENPSLRVELLKIEKNNES